MQEFGFLLVGAAIVLLMMVWGFGVNAGRCQFRDEVLRLANVHGGSEMHVHDERLRRLRTLLVVDIDDLVAPDGIEPRASVSLDYDQYIGDN